MAAIMFVNSKSGSVTGVLMTTVEFYVHLVMWCWKIVSQTADLCFLNLAVMKHYRLVYIMRSMSSRAIYSETPPKA